MGPWNYTVVCVFDMIGDGKSFVESEGRRRWHLRKINSSSSLQKEYDFGSSHTNALLAIRESKRPQGTKIVDIINGRV